MTEIIKDRKFENGFEVYHVEKRVVDKPISIINLCNTAKQYPSWKIAQWGNKNSLAGAEQFFRHDGRYQISDGSKKIVVDPWGGSVSCALDAGNEYTVPRVEGEAWPHILLEQQFDVNPYVLSSKSINLDIDICIDKVKCLQKYPKDIHTAQITWIFALADRTHGKGGGDFIWFGCPLYDYRWEYPVAYAAKDGGKPETTSKFIYFIDSKRYLDSPFVIGKRKRIKLDVKRFMEEALRVAKDRKFLPDSELEDIVLYNMNLGWEITGTFDAEFTLYNISVEVEE